MTPVAAEVVIPCADLDPTIAFFVDLGFRVEMISPADDPVTAVIAGFGVRLRLDRTATGDPGRLRLRSSDTAAGVISAPNGTVVEIVDAHPPLVVPPLVPTLSVSRAADATEWVRGRAGMQYRDLVPDRQGGRIIASHIRIPDGGPVPDYVHYHRIRFQMIFCVRGWVRVVYEGRGEPFVLRTGDCVLQPPLIRHRVLEACPGMEVVEVGSPAVHDTFGDPEMSLPTNVLEPDREFDGQRFVHHVAASAPWEPARYAGFERRDTGIGSATRGLAGVAVLRPASSRSTATTTHGGELLLGFVLSGALTLVVDGTAPIELASADSATVPAGVPYALRDCTPDLELLEVTIPAWLPTS